MKTWPKVKLGELISLAKTIRCGENVYPVLSMTMRNGLMLQTERFKKTIASVDQSAYKVVRSQQLVVGFPIDEGVLSIQNVVPVGIVSPAYAVWDVDLQRLESRYLETALRSAKSLQYYRAKLQGSTARRRNLTNADFLDLSLSLPPVTEQKRIVAELDAVVATLKKRQAQLAELNALVEARFVELFGDPATNPKGWGVCSLKELCLKLTDGTHYSPESFPEGDYKYITAKNIKADGFDFSHLTYISADVHREIYSRCNPENGDVLYIKDGATTGVAMVNDLDEEFSLLSSVALLKQNRSLIDAYYLRETLNHPQMYRRIRNDMGGAAISRLTISKLSKIEIPLPPLELQEHFAAEVERIEAIKATVRAGIAETQTLFDALTQRYFG